MSTSSVRPPDSVTALDDPHLHEVVEHLGGALADAGLPACRPGSSPP